MKLIIICRSVTTQSHSHTHTLQHHSFYFSTCSLPCGAVPCDEFSDFNTISLILSFASVRGMFGRERPSPNYSITISSDIVSFCNILSILSVFGNTNPGITLIIIIIMIITDRRGVKNLLSLLSKCPVTAMVPPIICNESMQSIFNCKKCQGAYS